MIKLCVASRPSSCQDSSPSSTRIYVILQDLKKICHISFNNFPEQGNIYDKSKLYYIKEVKRKVLFIEKYYFRLYMGKIILLSAYETRHKINRWLWRLHGSTRTSLLPCVHTFYVENWDWIFLKKKKKKHNIIIIISSIICNRNNRASCMYYI